MTALQRIRHMQIRTQETSLVIQAYLVAHQLEGLCEEALNDWLDIQLRHYQPLQSVHGLDGNDHWTLGFRAWGLDGNLQNGSMLDTDMKYAHIVLQGDLAGTVETTVALSRELCQRLDRLIPAWLEAHLDVLDRPLQGPCFSRGSQD